jgi:alpha-tubulin suppressor-like RCC1 family protein
VTYGFGRNQHAQLGVGDFKDRNKPTPIPTAYAKVAMVRSGDNSNLLLWEVKDEIYSWGRDNFGQLGQGPTVNDTLPNRVFMDKPVLVSMGGDHTALSVPPAPANMFDYDDFAGKREEFVHYGDSSQPIAPPDLCPRCVPWEDGTPTPTADAKKYTGRQCQNPPWSESSGISIVGVWCFVQKGGTKPCPLSQQVPFGTAEDRSWWIVSCKDTARFSITPDPPARLAVGAVWRKARVQVYQAWRMSLFFRFRKSEKVTNGGNGLVVAIQNHGIDEASKPIGAAGRDMGLARSTRYSFNDGVPNSFGIEVRSIDSNGAIEIRGCYGGAYSADNSLAENARCQIGISYWKPERLCSPLDPDTCCTDAEIRDVNKCFKEDIKDGAPHQLTIVYSPFSMEVYLDDPRFPKIRADVDIRQHVRSYVCNSGPNKDKACQCDGDSACGGKADTESCPQSSCKSSGMAWVGFTAASGDSYSVHEVESWSFYNLGQDGAVRSVGRNLYGQLGLADDKDRRIANLIVGLDGMVVKEIATGKEHTVALTTTGQIYTWGANHFGQLGQGDIYDRNVPSQVRVLEALKTAASAGDPCVCTPIVLNCQNEKPVIKADGKPGCTFNVVKITAGAFHSLAVIERDNDAHEIWGWGDNSFGQLGCLDILGTVTCPWVLKPPGTLGNWPTPEILAEECSGTNPRCMTTPRKLAMFDRYGRQGMVFNLHSLSSGAYHNILITKNCPNCPLPSLCKNQQISREECDCDAGARTRSNVPLLWIQESPDCIAKDLEIYAWGANTRGQLGNNCSNNAHHDYLHMGPNKHVCPDSPIPIRLNSPRSIHLLPYYPNIFPYLPNKNNPKLPTMKFKPKTIIVGGYHNLLVFEDQSIVVSILLPCAHSQSCFLFMVGCFGLTLHANSACASRSLDRKQDEFTKHLHLFVPQPGLGS